MLLVVKEKSHSTIYKQTIGVNVQADALSMVHSTPLVIVISLGSLKARSTGMATSAVREYCYPNMILGKHTLKEQTHVGYRGTPLNIF